MSELAQKASRAAFWSALNALFVLVFQLAQYSILGRILKPSDFGLMALAIIVIGFAELFSELGLSAAIIQRKDPTQNELSSLYWINILFGGLLFVLILALTPLLASLLKHPELERLIPVTAISFIAGAFGAQFKALMQKSLQLHIFALITFFSFLAGFACSVLLALAGWGVWALVYGFLSNMLLQNLLFVLYGIRSGFWPKLHCRFADISGYLSFGLYKTGAMVANYVNARVDQLLIGRMFGPTILGYYSVAFRLAMDPTLKISPIIGQVAFPVFSIVQDDLPRLQKIYLRTIRLLMAINAPLLMGLCAVAPLAVPILMGDQWEESIPLLQLLTIYALCRTLSNAGGHMKMAKGKANWSFYWNLSMFCFVAPTIYLAAKTGDLEIVVGAVVGLQLVFTTLDYFIFLRRLIGPCLQAYLFALGVPILLSLVMLLSVMFVDQYLAGMKPFVALIIECAVGGLVYTGLTFVFQRNVPKDLWSMVFRKQAAPQD